MQQSRILFFAPHGDLQANGVLHSQFLCMAQYLQTQGAHCAVLGLIDTDRPLAETRQTLQEKYGVDVHLSAHRPVRFMPLSNRRLAWRVLEAHRETIEDFSPTHVYTRTPRALLAAASGLAPRGVRTVYDARGALGPEYLMTEGQRNLAYLEMTYLEKRALRKADLISAVTANLAEYISRISGRDTDAIVPCCVTTDALSQRNPIDRATLGFTNEHTLYCYCGGTSKWQRIEDVVRLCLNLSKTSPQARFLFLSKDAGRISEIARQAGLAEPLFAATSCDQEHTRSYLQAGDAGIIIRHDDTVNNVACPIKVGEYLSAGLPVVLTAGIGTFSNDLPNKRIGIVVDDNTLDAQAVVDFMDNRNSQDITARGEEYRVSELTWTAHRKQFANLYDRLG